MSAELLVLTFALVISMLVRAAKQLSEQRPAAQPHVVPRAQPALPVLDPEPTLHTPTVTGRAGEEWTANHGRPGAPAARGSRWRTGQVDAQRTAAAHGDSRSRWLVMVRRERDLRRIMVLMAVFGRPRADQLAPARPGSPPVGAGSRRRRSAS